LFITYNVKVVSWKCHFKAETRLTLSATFLQTFQNEKRKRKHWQHQISLESLQEILPCMFTQETITTCELSVCFQRIHSEKLKLQDSNRRDR
jgi:hypothetical protein